ncbi:MULTISPECIES: helix-turn-helix transcriptional regulator [Klebsiella]|uniref:helix-turn-helix transcriptional regulator n=1 Tax=Klebsiella TaxID=570 RepID=UPI000E2DE9D4|nr:MULTISPECIES: WYL domain-containing protein [Klebsiella]HBQ5717461.1 WYL domain-containing protein [Klebsiella pneumoniae subsp. pneumoniae]HDH1530254.1 WYL domain-containing protein [Klebsiella quasipneumoniae subsp. similipneumoniae]MBQ5092038.1 WYL domain-containing protein [Klebsiella pneumoniae]MCE7469285.1 WYL domain-containing protein [Klebsiella quasipneumoniae]MCG5584981.1 WYL domain-containing protein [Klebsiella pneumoniae]
MSDQLKRGDERQVQKGRQGARWGQERRLEFIDYRLRWDGHINRSDLTDFFGISVPQASLDLSEYAKLAKDNLEYDVRARVYRSTNLFNPVFATSSLECYLNDLLSMAVKSDMQYGSFLGWHAPVAAVPRLLRRLDVDITCKILRAIRENEAVQVLYQSMKTPEGSERKLTPHSLVHDGYRWHTRAWCHKSQTFRDFLLSRIIQAGQPEPDEDRSECDMAWNNWVEVVLIAHPELSPSQRHLIESDYAMANGEAHLQCRQALLHYLLFQLNLTEAQSKQTPEALQLSLKNKEEIYSLLRQ